MGEAINPGVYAVIRDTNYLQRDAESAPAYVMHVEKETDTSLMGTIFAEGTKADEWSRGFDTRPSFDVSGYGRNQTRTRTKAGRVRKTRLFSRHATIEEAWSALKAAGAAWGDAADRDHERDASDAVRAAYQALQAEEARLKEEMQAKLADLRQAVATAEAHRASVRAEGFEKRTQAALAALTPLSSAVEG